jgi:hypothetical protein
MSTAAGAAVTKWDPGGAVIGETSTEMITTMGEAVPRGLGRIGRRPRLGRLHRFRVTREGRAGIDGPPRASCYYRG